MIDAKQLPEPSKSIAAAIEKIMEAQPEGVWTEFIIMFRAKREGNDTVTEYMTLSENTRDAKE